MDMTCSCTTEALYSEEFDTYYCKECDQWTEDKCDDATCEYCTNRPEKPSQIQQRV